MRKSRVLLAAAGLFVGLGCLWVRVAILQTALHGHFAARARELLRLNYDRVAA